jgi:catechol 2,3-dioxygenase-like lactoylglutathione lyase family enzyme
MADPFLRVHAVNIYVRDQARSLDFYLNTLGFHIAYDARVGSGERLLAVAPPDGSAVLTLIQARPDTPQARFVGRATQVVFVTEDLPATYTEWRRRGVRFQNAPRLRRVVYDRTGDAADPSPPPSTEQDRSAWGGAFTRFEDVDRNSFSLVSFDEVSRAVEAQRRAAAEKQEAERRAAQELEIAMQVQSRLFPQRLPPMRTLEYAGACVQTHRVGGDYYDFLDLGHVGVPNGGAPFICWRSSGDLHRWHHRGLRRPGRRVRGRTARGDAARPPKPSATRSDRRHLRRRPPLQPAGTARRHDVDCREVPELPPFARVSCARASGGKLVSVSANWPPAVSHESTRPGSRLRPSIAIHRALAPRRGCACRRSTARPSWRRRVRRRRCG